MTANAARHLAAFLEMLSSERGAADKVRSLLAPRMYDNPSPWAVLLYAGALHGLGLLTEADRWFELGIREVGPIERSGYTDVRPVATDADRDAFGQLRLASTAEQVRA